MRKELHFVLAMVVVMCLLTVGPVVYFTYADQPERQSRWTGDAPLCKVVDGQIVIEESYFATDDDGVTALHYTYREVQDISECRKARQRL